MLTPLLQSLKQILQEHLEVCQESDDYKESISDAQYACELGESALETIFQAWNMMPSDWGLEYSSEINYYRGCCYVHDQWNIIKEKEDEKVRN